MSRNNKPLVLSGLMPATITPFDENLEVDYWVLEKHLRETLAPEGVTGIVVNAGLAEILQLNLEEQIKILELATRLLRPGQLLVTGLIGLSAREMVEKGRQLKAAGAEAFLVFPPFDIRAYRKLFEHLPSVINFFAQLNQELNEPLIVFAYPPHSGSSYTLDSLKALAKLQNVVAIKAASGNISTYQEIWNTLHDELSVLVAVDSPPLLDMLLHGSHGALIGISAIATEKWAELLALVHQNDLKRAHDLFDKVCRPLMASVFENQQPKRPTSEASSVKEALRQMGQLRNSLVRPPAVNVDDEVIHEIQESLKVSELTPW
jgi:4-hydroxy-tetrahydrodipicolinate synthase